MQFSRLISINTSVCPWTNVTVSSIEVFNTSSIVSWLFFLRTLITVPRSLNFSILSNMKRRNNKNTYIDSDSFLDGPPQIKYKTQPIGRILDNLAIVFEATAFKAAFFSFLLFVNTSLKTDLSTLKTHSIPLSPLSGLVSVHEQLGNGGSGGQEWILDGSVVLFIHSFMQQSDAQGWERNISSRPPKRQLR